MCVSSSLLYGDGGATTLAETFSVSGKLFHKVKTFCAGVVLSVMMVEMLISLRIVCM